MNKINTKVAIIGAGITGCAIAREISRYKIDAIVIEKEADIGWGTSKANSGNIHPGYAGEKDTLKLSLCRKGHMLFKKNAEELSIPIKTISSFLNIFKPDQLKDLNKLLKQGKKYGVPGLKIIQNKNRLLKSMEPNISNNVIAALHCSKLYVTSPYEVTIAISENAKNNGINFLLDSKVHSICFNKQLNRFFIETINYSGNKLIVESEFIVNAAGVYSDEIAGMIDDYSFKITAIKGQYFLLDIDVKNLVKFLNIRISDPDSEESKGMYVGKTPNGNFIMGSNYEVTTKEDTGTSKESLDEIKNKLSEMIENIPYDKVIATFAGLRAYADTGDFVLGPSVTNLKFINAAGIQSPGFTCAFIIAKIIVEYLKDSGLALVKNPKFIPERIYPERLVKDNYIENNKNYNIDQRYGEIVCRCEKVSEAEIIYAIKNGANTLDGVKFRTRAGMGRCQGGYCTLKVMKILSRELGVPLETITKSGDGSYIAKFKAH